MKFFKAELIPSVFSHKSFFTGTVEVAGNLRLDGKIVGDIKCFGKLSVGKTGVDDSKKMDLDELETSGDIKGNVVTKRTTLLNGSNVSGTIKTKK